MTLKEYLILKKLTQKKFAEICGVTQPTICRLIKKKVSPTLDTAIKIAKATKNKVNFQDFKHKGE